MSSALPCGTPSTTSNRITSPSSSRAAMWASVPPIMPEPMRAIFARAMWGCSGRYFRKRRRVIRPARAEAQRGERANSTENAGLLPRDQLRNPKTDGVIGPDAVIGDVGAIGLERAAGTAAIDFERQHDARKA